MTSGSAFFWQILFALLLPPLGVFLRYGSCTAQFFVCLLLTLLGYLPGIIYALYLIVQDNRDGYDSLV